MDKKFDLNRLNVKAFAKEGLSLQGQLSLAQLPRLAELALSPVESSLQDSGEPAHVSWALQGELVLVSDGDSQIWMHLKAEVDLPMQCQRCMGKSTSAFKCIQI